MQKQFFSLFIGLILFSCGTTIEQSYIQVPNEQLPEANGSLYDAGLQVNGDAIEQRIPLVYQASRTILTELVHTKLEVSFDWQKSRLKGTETLTAKQHCHPSDSLILDAKGMDILSVQMNNKPLSFSYDSTILKIQLDRQYKRGELFTVTITYIAKPEERLLGGSDAITSDKGLFFINPDGKDNRKMPQIWTQGETESSSVWFPTIDSPNAKTTQETLITVDRKYTSLSNGKLLSSKENGDGTRTDHWKQDLPHAPYLFMMAIGEFKMIKDSYTRTNGKKMEVNYYVEPEWESSAKAIFGETPKMIAYFSTLLGYEFAWDKYSQIVVRDYVSGAMENTGAVVFGDYVYKTNRELLDGNDQSTIAHELFHHWFGDLVTCESWSNLPLNESFANYSQYLWDEHRYGLDEADYQAEVEMDGYFQSAQAQGYHNLIWFNYNNREQMFDGHSYNKGGRILHMLRNYLGDEVFFRGISLYLNTNQFKPAEFHQLRLAFEEVSGEDLNWFFNQWFLGSGHPILDIKQHIDTINHTVTVQIDQKQNLDLSPMYRLPIEIAVFDDNGKHLHKVVAENLTNSFQFSYVGNLACVIVDNEQMLLAKIREEKPIEQSVFQYYNSNRYKARKEALVYVSSSKSEKAQQVILDGLSDTFWGIRVLAVEKASKLSEPFKNHALAIIQKLSVLDSCSKVRSKALDYLADHEANNAFEARCLNTIEKDSSYLVVSTALQSLAKVSPEQAVSIANKLEKESSSSLLASIAQLYGEFGNTDNFSFFESALKSNKLQGYDEVGVMNSMTYLVSREDVQLLDKSYELFVYLSKEGGTYTKLFLSQNTNYLIENITSKINTLTDELTSNPAEKDSIQAKIESLEKIKSKFEALTPIEK